MIGLILVDRCSVGCAHEHVHVVWIFRHCRNLVGSSLLSLYIDALSGGNLVDAAQLHIAAVEARCNPCRHTLVLQACEVQRLVAAEAGYEGVADSHRCRLNRWCAVSNMKIYDVFRVVVPALLFLIVRLYIEYNGSVVIAWRKPGQVDSVVDSRVL